VDVLVDGQKWIDPPQVAAGSHTLWLAAPGYDPVLQQIEVSAGQTVTVRGALVDTTPPQATLQAIPAIAAAGAPVNVRLELTDQGSGLNYLEFLVNGELKLSQPLAGRSLQSMLKLIDLPTGLHKLELATSDQAGQVARQERYIEVTESPRSPAVDVDAATIPSPGEVIESTSEADAASLVETVERQMEAEAINLAPAEQAATWPAEALAAQRAGERKAGTERLVRTETMTIPTYGYEQALSGSPRPTLDITGPFRRSSKFNIRIENSVDTS